MKQTYHYFLIAIILLGFTLSCSNKETENNKYSFFVAGHVYGYPGESKDNIGVHPPFKAKLDIIRNNTQIEFGVFTGDIVEDGKNEMEWDELDADVAYTGRRVYFAPGNHDIQNSIKRAIFKKRYGDSYRSFKHKNDLVIILDPNLDKWNISGDQLSWLKHILATEGKKADHIFVFFHQLLWMEKEGIFKKYQLNSYSGRAEEINFRSVVCKLFEATKKQTYMFAGDTGVYNHGYMYYKDSNTITFIASGMGGRKQDNFIIVDVKQDKSVEFQLISLNGDDITALGKLEDYVLP